MRLLIIKRGQGKNKKKKNNLSNSVFVLDITGKIKRKIDQNIQYRNSPNQHLFHQYVRATSSARLAADSPKSEHLVVVLLAADSLQVAIDNALCFSTATDFLVSDVAGELLRWTTEQFQNTVLPACEVEKKMHKE